MVNITTRMVIWDLKCLKIIFLHPAIERGPGQAQFTGGFADVALMLAQDFPYHGLIHIIQIIRIEGDVFPPVQMYRPTWIRRNRPVAVKALRS